MSMIAWSLATMREGKYPDKRHDGLDFGHGDEARGVLANTKLGFRAVCMVVKGDWQEFIHTLGLPTFAVVNSPCPLCLTDVPSMYSIAGFSPLAMQSARKTARHYDAACTSCERIVLVRSIALQSKIRASPVYDKRPYGKKGRVLATPIPELRLEAGDRLEPGPLLADVAAFEQLTPPFSVCFWRVSEETHARHRNPLFSSASRCSPWG